MKTFALRILPALIASATLSTVALAATPGASLIINQYDASGSTVTKSWTQDVSALVTLDTQSGNFTMLSGTTTSGTPQTIGSGDNTWTWKQTDNTWGWNWHSADKVTDPTAEGNGTWLSTFQINTLGGHGDPDLSYGFSARNATTSIQTYTFSVGEAIIPPVSGTYALYADVGASLSNPSGTLTIAPVGPETTLQQFLLSSDNGVNFINAGVNVGPSLSTGTIGTTSYGTYAASSDTGPTGSWNYMKLQTTFTLTPNKDVASISGFASITPASPVPEPAGYALVGSGLLLMGFMATRRKSA